MAFGRGDLVLVPSVVVMTMSADRSVGIMGMDCRPALIAVDVMPAASGDGVHEHTRRRNQFDACWNHLFDPGLPFVQGPARRIVANLPYAVNSDSPNAFSAVGEAPATS
jgi:hypothetical protein